LFFVSNLIIIPFLGILLGIGILIIALALIGYLPPFLVTIYNTMILYMNSIIRWIAAQEAFLFSAISFDVIQLFLSYVLIISMTLALTKKSFNKWVVFLCSIICLQCYNVYSLYKTQQTEKLIVMHQNKNTVLLHQSGENLYILSSKPTPNNNTIKDYRIAERIRKIQHQPLKNSYTTKFSTLYIMDSLAIYPPKKTDIILLTQSPKINLERFIDSIAPTIIIADGSNYKTTVHRWKITCKKRKLPFHHTGEKGAYYFNLVATK